MMCFFAPAILFMILSAAHAGERNTFKPQRILTDDQRINDDTGMANQDGPAIAMHKYGLSVAAWRDPRDGGSDIYFQLFNRRGQPFGTLGNVKVNDAAHTDYNTGCDVAMDGFGNFMVAWSGGSGLVSHVFGQWYLANGRPLGGNVQIDETEAAVMNGKVAVEGLNSGGAVAVWTDRRADPKGDLWFQRFGRAGVRLGSNIAVDTESTEAQEYAAVDADLAGNLSAAAHLIHGSSEGRFKITYCPGHLTREEVEGANFRYADLGGMLQKYDPARLKDGPNVIGGEEIFYIPNPAIGLWAFRGRFERSA